MKLGLAIFVVVGVLPGLVAVYASQTDSNQLAADNTPQEKTLEQQAEESWMDGCVPHVMEEARKLTDIVDEEAATAKAAIYCACDWSYMRDPMGLSLEDIASIEQEGSRGSSAIVEAQNYCYERYKGSYYP